MSALEVTPVSSPRSGTAPDSLLQSPTTLSSASSLPHDVPEGVLKGHTDEQQFVDKRDTLVEGIDHTTQLLSDLQEFEEGGWTVRYPSELGVQTPGGATSLPSTPVRRNTTEPGAFTEPRRPDHARTTSEHPSAEAKTPSAGAHPLSILSLDLRLERHGGAPSLPALLPSLSPATLSQLLSRRLASSRSHLGVLRSRVLDRSSRILITGDLNAGKSSLTNALLRRDIMPVDQQPCTEVFTEVLDAQRCNNGVEEVHAVRVGELDAYDPTDASTFERFGLDQLEKVVQIETPEDDEAAPESPYQMVKVYLDDVEATEADEGKPGSSLVRNGLVDISLIDAPGLNRDTLSTTAVFARQSEIDVIVFVVSAENHFTLSAKEFLWNASREKAYVFVVVNKWGGIRDKARCRRLVGEQIRQLSPATWEARDELVHYVESADVVVEALKAAQTEHEAEGGETVVAPEFAHMEDSLKSFVLLKRSQSKLAPAKHYLLNLLSDLSVLADANLDAAEAELEVANATLERVRPEHERLSAARDDVEDGIARVEEDTVDGVRDSAAARLERAVADIADGRVAAARQGEPIDSSWKAPSALPEYPGLLGLWNWAGDVKETLMRSLEGEVRGAEEQARGKTTGGVREIMVDLGNSQLPEADRKNERVFRPEVMFARRRKGMEGALTARSPGTTGLGLSLGAAWAAQDVDVSILDLVDLEKIFSWGRSVADGRSVSDKVADEAGTLSVVSLGVGALTMFGTRAVGVRGFVEALARACEVLGSKEARKWVGPVVGVATLGVAVYIVIDLPCAVPRNIGRKLQASLAGGSTQLAAGEPLAIADGTSRSFAGAHSERIAKETRKVLRLAGWDLRERFRTALEKSEAERKQVEATQKQAEDAIEWLTDFIRRTEENESAIDAVDLTPGVSA